MKKALVSTALAFTLIVVAPAAFGAGSQNATLNVSASVAANCTITAGLPLSFGAYDPVGANASTGLDLDAQTTMTVLCTKGFTPNITTLAAGGAMTSTPAVPAYTLNYLLFTTNARTTSFVSPGLTMPASASNKTPQTLTIYGRIAKDQDVGVAAYNGTTTVTVNF